MGRSPRHPGHRRRGLQHFPRAGPHLSPVRGAIPSPNIWAHPEIYEIENAAVDRGHLIESEIERIRPLAGTTLIDIGCGTGYHLPRWADSAERVIGVEPHRDLATIARRRTRRLSNVEVRLGAAQQLPVPDSSVDVAHARWAYFFGPGCEPGLKELDRVMRAGGVAFVIDNDATRSTFGGWFRRGYPEIDPRAVERFWATHGWQRVPLEVTWEFDSRADFEAVVSIEFNAPTAEAIIAEHQGTRVDYAINLWWRKY